MSNITTVINDAIVGSVAYDIFSKYVKATCDMANDFVLSQYIKMQIKSLDSAKDLEDDEIDSVAKAIEAIIIETPQEIKEIKNEKEQKEAFISYFDNNKRIINAKNYLENYHSNSGTTNFYITVDKEKKSFNFKQYYKDNFSTIFFLLNKKSKPIEDIYINLAIIKEQEDNEEEDEKLLKREITLNSYEEIYKPKEPIDIKELIKTSKKSLIFGKAGVGKTTLCKYISYMWADNKLFSEFEQVIYLQLRQWSGDGGLKTVIRDNYISRDYNIDITINDSSKILFLFDGYDELTDDKKRILRNEIERNTLLSYIITTRPYGYQRNDFSVDKHFETIGFTDENVDNYIDKFFKEEKQKIVLKEFLIKNRDIKHIAYIPLMLEMICTLWQDKAKSGKTLQSPMNMTEFYSEVVNNIINKFSRKKDDNNIYEAEDSEYIKLILGKIAFKALVEQRIVFNYNDFLKDILNKEEREYFKTKVIKSGVLKTDRTDSSLFSNSFEFLHLSIQEYFASYYVANLSKKKQKKIISKYKFHSYMQIFFTFLGGLVENKDFFIKQIISKPKDRLGFYEILFLMLLFSQIKKDEIDTKYIDMLDDKIIFWLKFLTKNKQFDYELFLDRLLNLGRSDDKIVDTLIDFIKDENIDYLLREYVAKSLSNLGRSDDKIVDTLIDFIKNENIDYSLREDVAKSLSNLGRSDDKIVDTLIDFIKDENIYSWVRRDVAESLSNLGRSDDKIVDTLIDIIKDKNIDSSFRRDVAESLSNLGRSDDRIVDTLIDFIKDENILSSVRSDVAESLSNLGRSDDKIVDTLIDIIKDKNIDSWVRRDVAESLSNLGRSDDKIVDTLIDIIDKNINSSFRRDVAESLLNLGRSDDKFVDYINIYYYRVRGDDVAKYLSNLINKDITILKRIDINSYSTEEFEEKIFTSVLIEAFNKGINNIKKKNIINSMLYNKLPLYKKDDKYYTFVDGKEIKIKRVKTSLRVKF